MGKLWGKYVELVLNSVDLILLKQNRGVKLIKSRVRTFYKTLGKVQQKTMRVDIGAQSPLNSHWPIQHAHSYVLKISTQNTSAAFPIYRHDRKN